MSTATIIAMASIGVVSAIGEKVLNSLGKSDMASLCNIAGLCGIGLVAVGVIVKLLKLLATL